VGLIEVRHSICGLVAQLTTLQLDPELQEGFGNKSDKVIDGVAKTITGIMGNTAAATRPMSVGVSMGTNDMS
jgi:hypothetical protein